VGIPSVGHPSGCACPANFSTTQRIYTHVDEAAMLDAVARLNQLLGGAK